MNEPLQQKISKLTTLLAALRKDMPGIWQDVQTMRDGRGDDLPNWPKWCFLPMAAWLSIISHQRGRPEWPNLDDSKIMPAVASIGTWRYTQGIYQFDDDLLTALTDSQIVGELPAEVLLRLPEWCVYISLPDGGGYFVHLEWDANSGRTELRFWIDAPSVHPLPLPLIMHLGPWTVTEAFDRSFHEGRRIAQLAGSPFPQASETVEAIEEGSALLQRLLPPVLYLCSDEPELAGEEPGSRPGNPQLTKTKKGAKLFAPQCPRIWRVGESIGQALRELLLRVRARRGHLRRAHWHGYWTGRDGERLFKYHWIPPVMVRSTTPAGTPNDSTSESA